MPNRLIVRLADPQDVELLWEWANDPDVRHNSFHNKQIPYEEHLDWLTQKLASTDTRLWIAEVEGFPIAQIRYDLVDIDTAEVGISVDRNQRGKGYAIEILGLTSSMAQNELGVRCLKAIVFESNESSFRTFVKAGYDFAGYKVVLGICCRIYVYTFPDRNSKTNERNI